MRSGLSRRDFVRAVGAAAGGAVLSRSTGRRPRRGPTVGSGAFTFEAVHDWLSPPEGLLWGDTHGLTQSKDGRIFVAHTVHPSSERSEAVAVYSETGSFVTAWGPEFRGGAHGLDLREEDGVEFLYHCDTRRRLVVKTTLSGEVVWEAGWPREAGVYQNEGAYCPTNVAFEPGGDLFVGDGYGSSYVHRFTADGSYVATIIGPGTDAGQVSCPHGLWVDSRGSEARLVVADRSNRRLQYFSLAGNHLGFVTDGIRRPCHFKTRGDLLLVPDLESVVTILDGENRVTAHLGDGHPSGLRGAPREEFVPGRFIHPHDAIFLTNGDVLVAEWVPIGRITLLKRL